MAGNESDILKAARRHFDLEVARRERAGDETMAVHRIVMPWSVDRLGPEVTDGRQLLAIEAAVNPSGRRRYFTDRGTPIRWIETVDELQAQFFECLQDATGQPWSVLCKALNAAWDMAAVSPDPGETTSERRDFLDTLDEAVDRFLSCTDPWLDHSLRVGASKVAEATVVEWRRAFERGRILVFRREGGVHIFCPPHSWRSGPPIRCPSFADLQRQRALAREERLRSRLQERDQRRLLGRRIALEDFALSMRLPNPMSISLKIGSDASRHSDFAFLPSGELLGLFEASGEPRPDSAIEQGSPGHLPPTSVAVEGATSPFQLSGSAGLEGRRALKRGRPGYSVNDAPLVADIAGRFIRGEFATISEAVEHAFIKERDRFTGFATEENLKARVRKKVGARLRQLDDIGSVADPNISN
jgi:hypothetical protein